MRFSFLNASFINVKQKQGTFLTSEIPLPLFFTEHVYQIHSKFAKFPWIAIFGGLAIWQKYFLGSSSVLHSLPVNFQMEFNVSVLTYENLISLEPSYLTGHLSPCAIMSKLQR